MLFLRADSVLQPLAAPEKPSFWSSFSRTTKVALGVLGVGAIVAATAVTFGATALVAGGVIALSGVAIYTYGRIMEMRERATYVKPVFAAPDKHFDYVPKPQDSQPPANPAPAKPKAVIHLETMVFPNRAIFMGQKATAVNMPKIDPLQLKPLPIVNPILPKSNPQPQVKPLSVNRDLPKYVQPVKSPVAQKENAVFPNRGNKKSTAPARQRILA